MQINAYLGYNGNCEEAFKFYEKVLGGKIEALVTYGSTPMAAKMPDDFNQKIAHVRLVADGQVLMGGDMPCEQYAVPKGITVCINPKNAAEADRIFNELSKDGNVTMPYGETFWAERFGSFTDRYGIPWMINLEKAFQPATAGAKA